MFTFFRFKDFLFSIEFLPSVCLLLSAQMELLVLHLFAGKEPDIKDGHNIRTIIIISVIIINIMITIMIIIIMLFGFRFPKQIACTIKKLHLRINKLNQGTVVEET